MKLFSIKTVWTVFVCVCTFSVGAQQESWNVRLGSSALTLGESLVLEDDKFDDIVNATADFEDVGEVMRVALGIEERPDEDYTGYTGILLELNLTITPYDDTDAPQSPIPFSLEVGYSAMGNEKLTDLDVYEVTGYHKAEVEITGVTVKDLGGTPQAWAVPVNAYLELRFETDRYYNLDMTVPTTGHYLMGYTSGTGEEEIISSGTTTTAQTIGIEVFWGYVPGAREYELEWCWVDNFGPSGSGVLSAGTIPLSEVDFARNHTRIRTTNQQYRIPVIYAKGYLIWRVRGIGRWMTAKDRLKYGSYSSGVTTKVKVSDWPDVIQIGQDHQELMNWQYQSTYAEEGKRKEVVSYFDGSLRNRQTVTRLSSDNEAIVGESIYDNQGRAAIQVLPSPVGSPVIGYYPDLNRNTSNTVFTHWDFDWENDGATSCGEGAGAMNDVSGAGKYYSSNNAALDNWQDRVPQANGYPFSQVEYTPDNTGRIRRQSGVGVDHKLGSGHETQYFYLQPSQEELNRLFGYKVGYKARYKKNMVIDANGQVSVSYLDPQGRVIATAIAGGSPAMFDNLEDEANTNMHRVAFADLLGKLDPADPDTPVDDNNLFSSGRFGTLKDELRMSTELGVTQENSVYDFNYALQAGVYTDSCLDSLNMCYPYVYDVAITLVDDCGAEYQAGGAVQTTVGGSHVGYSDCTDLSYSVTKEATMDAGSYTLSKTLQVNEAAYQEYLAHYLENACLYTPEDFLDEVDTTSCFSSCTECLTSLGTKADYINERLSGYPLEEMTVPQTDSLTLIFESEYDLAVVACNAPCDPVTQCQSLRASMEGDMSPMGQYGNINGTNSLSVYNTSNVLSAYLQIPGQTHWKNPASPYLDENGSPSYVEVVWDEGLGVYYPETSATPPAGNPQSFYVKPEELVHVSDFISYWQSSWAASLVNYHPEYCYLEFYDALCAASFGGVGTLLFDEELRVNHMTYAEAIAPSNVFGVNLLAVGTTSGGWGIAEADPFYRIDFETGNSYVFMTHTFKKNLLNAILTDYKGTGKSMLEVATELAVCGTNFSGSCSPGPIASLSAQSLQDRAWNIYKNLYLSIRTDLIAMYADIYARQKGCFNGCIGSNDYNFIWTFFPHGGVSLVTTLVTEFDLAGIGATSPNCFFPGFGSFVNPYGFPMLPNPYYANKQPRVLRGDALYNNGDDLSESLNELMNDGGYNVWMNTGSCPLSFDLKYLLEGLSSHDHFSNPAVTINTDSIPEFTTALYASLGAMNPHISDVFIESSIVSATMLHIDVTDVAGTLINCPVVLETPSSAYNWNDHGTVWTITSFGDLYYVPGSYNAVTGTYDFRIAVWVGAAGSPLEEIILSGSTCAAIGECGVGAPAPHQSFEPASGPGVDCSEESFLLDMGNSLTDIVNEVLYYGATYDNYPPDGYVPDALEDLYPYVQTSSTDSMGVWYIDTDRQDLLFTSSFSFFPDSCCTVGITYEGNTEPFSSDSLLGVGITFSNYSFPISGDIYFYFSSGDTLQGSVSLNGCEGGGAPSRSLAWQCFAKADCPCVPQPVAPVSCSEAWENFEDSVTLLVVDYVLPEYMDQDYFCHMNLQYISAAYLQYLVGMGIDSTTHTDYLTIGEFGDTPLGYGHDYMPIIVSNYMDYLDTATVNRMDWQAFAAFANEYLLNRDIPTCPPAPMYVELPDTLIPYNCFEFEENVAVVNGQNQYAIYLDAVISSFRQAYVEGAMTAAVETFTMEYPDKEYHYTLYYYDQAGNLVQTVPPQGVDRMSEDNGTPLNAGDLLTLNTGINTKRQNNPTAEDVPYAPEHSLRTQYKYNSLNQLVWQRTPDGGESRFAYDALGRMVASQNAKQKTEFAGQGEEQFSYTRYDGLGRVVEVGEMTLPLGSYTITDQGKLIETGSGALNLVDSWLYPTNLTSDREEVIHTLYDEIPSVYQSLFINYTPYHACKRISAITFQEVYNPIAYAYNSAITYDYDVHGNVRELLSINLDSDIQTWGTTAVGQQAIKRLQYEYDMVSGNVNKVIYQAGEPDQFMHRYQYDSDNRITEVETSKDGKIWENDASYFYYSHGPLARTEIGDKKVQGIDYAYTIQGWIKGVNSEELAPEFDMGHDGGTAGTLAHRQNSQVAQDAFGYSLSYFEGDYQSRIAGADNFLRYSKNLPSSSANLYNGNIRDMYTAIMKDDETPLGTYNYQYQYDQLNRIKAMNSQGLSLSGSTIIPVAGLYETSYSYDRNGNIISLQRWADNGTTKTAMDEFTYDYITGTNKLAAVHDAVNAGNFTEDLDDQPGQYTGLGFTAYNLADETTHNYRYDAIGQLVQDKTEEIENIEWTVTGKVKKIERYAFSEKPDLAFDYDPMGQRITKTVYPKSAPGVIDVAGVEKTYYTRDAQGNVMTVYTLKAEDGETNLYLTERNLYGSSRLGVEQVNEVIASTSSGSITINTAQQRVVGDKRYELSNHLGNVLATISDRKLPEYNVTESLAYYKPDVVSYSDYMPFGMQMAERNGSSGDYRYGFNGMESDDEIKGGKKSYTTEFRMYDPCLGRWTSRDPLFASFPWQSPYAAFDNNPIYYNDPKGLSSESTTNNPPVENLTEHITVLAEKGSELLSKLNINHEYSVKSDMMFNENGDVTGWEGQVNYYNGNGEVMMSYKLSLSLDDKSQQDKKFIPEFPSGMMKVLDVTFPVLETALLSTAQTQFKYAHNPGSNLSLPTGDLKVYQQGAKIIGQIATVVVVSDELIKGVNALYDREYHQAGKHGVTAAGFTAAAIMMATPTGVTQVAGAALFVATWLYSKYYEAPRVGESAIRKEPIERPTYAISNGENPCFVPGTLVSTPSGFIQIEDLSIGDTVFSYNLVNKTIEKNVVYGNSKRTSNALYFLEIEGNEVRVTEEHPFYILNKKWVKVKDLQVGDSVLNQDGTFMSVNYIEKIKGSSIVYNLKISGDKNYFVTPVKLLVHNKDCFAEGSLVLLPDGKFLPIEKLNINDPVTSFDVSANRLKQTKVVKVIEVYHHKIVELTLDNGKKAILTQDHPVMGSDDKWKSFNPTETFCKTGIETMCYQTGDKIKLVSFNENSNSVVEENIITNIESKNEVHKMYNLVLEDGNTYIVDGIVVSTENSTVVDSFQYFQLYVP